MSTIHHDAAFDDATLSATEREWLERQGRAARALEARQRKLAARRERAAVNGRAANRARRPAPPRPR
jgi:hypothetical protein